MDRCVRYIMEGCACQHHALQEGYSCEVDHVIKLLQRKYISVPKILYCIDPQHADHFKSRNPAGGCCSTSSIIIPYEQLTHIERILFGFITTPFLASRLDELLLLSQQHFDRIVAKGHQENIAMSIEVQKMLVDRVLSETVNHFLFQLISQQIKQQAERNRSSIGLWATPATWYQQYPSHQLNTINKEHMGSLFQTKFTVCDQLFEVKGAFTELNLLQKQGKFEEVRSALNTKVFNHSQRLLNHTVLKPIILTLISLPFELNEKANLYCTATQDVQIVFYREKAFSKQNSSSNYFGLVCFGGDLSVGLSSKEGKISLSQGSLLLVDGTVEVSFESQSENIFVIYTWIHCLKKKE